MGGIVVVGGAKVVVNGSEVASGRVGGISPGSFEDMGGGGTTCVPGAPGGFTFPVGDEFCGDGPMSVPGVMDGFSPDVGVAL